MTKHNPQNHLDLHRWLMMSVNVLRDCNTHLAIFDELDSPMVVNSHIQTTNTIRTMRKSAYFIAVVQLSKLFGTGRNDRVSFKHIIDYLEREEWNVYSANLYDNSHIRFDRGIKSKEEMVDAVKIWRLQLSTADVVADVENLLDARDTVIAHTDPEVPDRRPKSPTLVQLGKMSSTAGYVLTLISMGLYGTPITVKADVVDVNLVIGFYEAGMQYIGPFKS